MKWSMDLLVLSATAYVQRLQLPTDANGKKANVNCFGTATDYGDVLVPCSIHGRAILTDIFIVFLSLCIRIPV
jgi:hypothetical protein